MPRTVLLVEADARLRTVFSMALLTAGYPVLEATSTSEGLELLGPTAEGVALLVSDADLSGEPSGRDLLFIARARRPDFPIVALAHGVPVPELVQGMALGGVRWLTKPVLPHELHDAVQALIGPGG